MLCICGKVFCKHSFCILVLQIVNWILNLSKSLILKYFEVVVILSLWLWFFRGKSVELEKLFVFSFRLYAFFILIGQNWNIHWRETFHETIRHFRIPASFEAIGFLYLFLTYNHIRLSSSCCLLCMYNWTFSLFSLAHRFLFRSCFDQFDKVFTKFCTSFSL